MATFLRGRFAHHERSSHGTELAPWMARMTEKRDHEIALASVVLETGKALPKQSGGDERTARGVPIIGFGVAGAIAGTSPDRDVATRLDKMQERLERAA